MEYLKEEKINYKGIRQHYLRYDIKKTSFLQSKSFIYDSTLCFPDMIGFRRGTCLPFRMFDLESNEILSLYQIPLNVMDVTLKEYMKLSPLEAYSIVKELIKEIKKYNGVFTLLWHPGNCSDEWNIWLKEFYEPLMVELESLNCSSLCGTKIIDLVIKNEF